MSRMTHLNTRHAAPLLAAAMLSPAGCSVGTPTATRALDTAQLPVLPSAIGAPELQAGAPPALWWQELGDARLEQLVKRAWQDNYDVRIATARLASASEFAQAARGARLPAVDLDAQAGRARLAAIESSDGQPHIASPVQWNAVFSWELDLFGRVRHSIAAAEASADERAAVRDDVRRLIWRRWSMPTWCCAARSRCAPACRSNYRTSPAPCGWCASARTRAAPRRPNACAPRRRCAWPVPACPA